jgi:hypothetical protein
MLHLITYATPRFRLRQHILGWSAVANGVVTKATHWNTESLLKAGFSEKCPDLSLAERGSAFWAWKPFIIQHHLQRAQEGDFIVYCDVGRIYPFKQLDSSLAPLLAWMEQHQTHILPGISIPWHGPMSAWTKRAAFVATQMDRPECHAATPIQASFSIWKASPQALEFCNEWLNLACQRALISDDPSAAPLTELPDFRENRHDQALLSLCCMRHGIKGIDLGQTMPTLDTRNPCAISQWLTPKQTRRSPVGILLAAIVPLLEASERLLKSVALYRFSHRKPNPNS